MNFRREVFRLSTKILFVRHGESAGNLSNRFYDSPGLTLTETGKMQAAAAGRSLRRYLTDKVDAIYCSPWRRAQETCEIALSRGMIRGRAVELDKRIQERSFAGVVGKLVNWDGKYDVCKDAISTQEYSEIWTYDSPISKKLGIEPLPVLEARVRDFLEYATRKHSDGTILVFSHGGTGRMMQAICDVWPEEGRFDKIKFLENGGIAVWTYER